MTTSPLLDQELDLTKVEVIVDGTEILHRAGRDIGGVTVMTPEDTNLDPRIRDVAGTHVGWSMDTPKEQKGVNGMISVLLGSPSATVLSKLCDSRKEVKVTFNSNGSGLGFKSQEASRVKFSPAPITIEPNGIRMYTFMGSGYVEIPN